MKIFRYLKTEWKALILVSLLLFAQAIAELSLPAYTSGLVNIGVAQSGVRDALAERLSAQSYADLLLLMDEGGKAAVSAAYREEGGLFVLRDNLRGEEKAAAGEALGLPMALLFGLSQTPEGSLALPALRQGLLDREKLLSLLPEGLPLAGEAGSLFVQQAAAQFVLKEYEALGVDTNAIRRAYLWEAGLKMLGLTLFAGLAMLITTYLSSRTGARVGRRLRSQIFAKVLSFSRAEMDRFSTASLITRSTNDIGQIQSTSVMAMRMLIYAPLMAIGGIWRVTQVKSGLGWIVALVVGLLLLLIGIFAYFIVPNFRKLQELTDRMNLVARENLTGVQVIRAFSREGLETARYGEANSGLAAVSRRINYIFINANTLMMLLINCTALLIVWFGAFRVQAGAIQAGTLIAFISYALQITYSFMMMAMVFTMMLPRAEVAAQRVNEVLDTQSAIADPRRPLEPAKGGGGLRFEGVSFRYPDSREEVLKDLNFTIQPGQTAAVIGATGSGKSTLVQLIPRFFDVSGGAIYLDGQDIRELPLSALRDKIGFVPQQALLFSGTIADNLRFAGEGLSDEDLRKAARLAQADKFIMEKEAGYESEVAQGGGNLSGGQRQRLSIARALAKKPELLLFDDSFSALDYRTDLLVRKALREEQKGATVLIVAQRIATVMQADTILVLEEGRLVGQGTHRELMATCPAYRQIAMSQLSEEELLGKEGGTHE